MTLAAFLAYLKARLGEHWTWVSIAGSVASAATLPRPWNWLTVGVGLCVALTPTPNRKDDPPC